MTSPARKPLHTLRNALQCVANALPLHPLTRVSLCPRRTLVCCGTWLPSVAARCLSAAAVPCVAAHRLCPASEALTEECFHRMPLPFVGQQSLRWDRKIGSRSDAGGVAGRGDASSADSKQIWFDGTYVTNGTVPTGSQWARNPLPRNDHHQTGAGFAPACVEPDDCDVTARCCGIDPMRCRCSGLWGPYNVEVVDTVRVPKGLPAGDYVLGWRWDCEERCAPLCLPQARESCSNTGSP